MRTYGVLVRYHSHVKNQPDLLYLIKNNDDPEKNGDTEYLLSTIASESIKVSLDKARLIVEQLYQKHDFYINQEKNGLYYRFTGYKFSASYILELDLHYDMKIRKQLSYTKNVEFQIS